MPFIKIKVDRLNLYYNDVQALKAISMQQAARISDFTAFFMLGELIEFDITSKIFTNPSQKITEDYVVGRFG